MPRTTKNNQKAWKTQWKKMTKILPKASPRDPNLLYMGGRWLRLCRLNFLPRKCFLITPDSLWGPKVADRKVTKKKCEGCCLKGSSGSPKAIQGPILQPCSSHCAAILKIWTLFVSSLKEKIAEKSGQRQIAANSGKKNKRQQIRANSSQMHSVRFLGSFGHLCCFSRFGTLALSLTPEGP